MLLFLSKRVTELTITLFGITLLSFFIIHLAPGKPTDVLTELNPKITPEAREMLEKYYGLDKPIIIQYLLWAKRIVKLDFGESFSTDRRPVWTKIKERIPVTISINLVSMILVFLIAIPIGISSATRQHSLFDKVTTIGVFVGFSMPAFWLGILLMMLFGVYLHILPISGIKSMNYDALSVGGKMVDVGRHLILIVFVSAIGGLAGISRYMRSSMLEVIRQDYITTARAKGLPERMVIYRHALRNALLPIITIFGLSVPGLLGGSVILEKIFGIPGMGQLFYMSVMTRDYPLIMGLLTIGAVLTLIGNMLADLCYALADPRTRRT
ncbi:dipeptide transport system permease protein DppB [bacterium BMS3Bbin06]|nr:dipeptide transport system permease protein DppB [bacterium BMS3Abin08]GBE33958.1 dipeptide transport system permease protein DppB [bacterium BMS3Bbin06]HDO34765.1 ABC transporter permease [Nitrospirota bacterium]HDY72414.1 ABC transporter permease [Nitrospirota bacterium]